MTTWASDLWLRFELGSGIAAENSARVRSALEALDAARVPGVRDAVPSYSVLLVALDPGVDDPEGTAARVGEVVAGAAAVPPVDRAAVEVPVCYAPEFAPDLDAVAEAAGLDATGVVALHTAADYRVAFLGFAPGFPYLEGLHPRLATPRLDRPRVRVPEGSVAIGGSQAGIYPAALPGGWRIVGRTPLRLFRPEAEPPSLLSPGDRLRFVAIDAGQFARLHAGRV